ncbi:MAG: glycosyltransferase family 2 protein, partial [Pseudomonadota bacterium]
NSSRKNHNSPRSSMRKSYNNIPSPIVTIAVPSLNQGRFLEAALTSIFAQDVPVEVFVADGGSSDCTLDVLSRFQDRLAGWRSYPDNGQSAAINECIERGTAPYVAWLNSDDLYLPGGLRALISTLTASPTSSAAYGQAWNIDSDGRRTGRVWTERFNERRLAQRCIISQPASLVRREIWNALGGLDERLQLAFDYDLWWRIFRRFGPLKFVKQPLACNRNHANTKTRRYRKLHYQEAIAIVRRHHGSVPSKWWLAWPYAVWFRGFINSVRN